MRGCSIATVTLTAVWLGYASCAGTPREPDLPPTAAMPIAQCAAADLDERLAAQADAPVIVLLHSTEHGQIDPVLAELGTDFKLIRRYDSLPGFAGTITAKGLTRARASAAVRCVQLDRPGSGG